MYKINNSYTFKRQNGKETDIKGGKSTLEGLFHLKKVNNSRSVYVKSAHDLCAPSDLTPLETGYWLASKT